MKMGTIASPWRYATVGSDKLQLFSPMSTPLTGFRIRPYFIAPDAQLKVEFSCMTFACS